MTEKKNFPNPTSLLQAALEQIEIFTKHDAASLEIGADGKLVASNETGLSKIVGLARRFVIPFFSLQARQAQEKKLNKIKEEILKARDVIQSHSPLIEKLKAGDGSQQKMALWAVEAISRYNTIVHESEDSPTRDVYNFEREQILKDEEIKGLEIRLPHTVSLKYDSHPDIHKTLMQVSEIWSKDTSQKNCLHISSSPKKRMQVMLDTFRMKAIRLVQSHLVQKFLMNDILTLIPQTPIDIDEESCSETILMRQVLEVYPGSTIVIKGFFDKHTNDAKFMSLPILKNLRMSAQSIQTGFPYPAQAGWTLSNSLTRAEPLRSEQIPHLHDIDLRKKTAAHHLLFDEETITRAAKSHKLHRETVNQNIGWFISLHQELHKAILMASHVCLEDTSAMESYYREVETAVSPFDEIVHTQEKLLALYFEQPMKRLEEEWLSGDPKLQNGSHQEKREFVSRILSEEKKTAIKSLDPDKAADKYILLVGNILGTAGDSIFLQYMSEKIGFPPPMLNEFEGKLQACAFQQLLTFLDEIEKPHEIETTVQVKESIEAKMRACTEIFLADTLERDLITDLEVYFNSRFYEAVKKLDKSPSETANETI